MESLRRAAGTPAVLQGENSVHCATSRSDFLRKDPVRPGRRAAFRAQTVNATVLHTVHGWAGCRELLDRVMIF
jgi:hypothetical protein